ncbi:MAG: endopeptidase La [Oscillospiraceae bacterium]|jgi:ATP-dependent Lon protease|nr:endopeptidase La [Oscillospiraceae bacterium]
MVIKDYTPLRDLPLVPMRGLIVFPDSRVHFEITRHSSMQALKAAMREQQEIVLVAQKDMLSESPTLEQLHGTGVIATVRQVLKGAGGEARVFIEGQCRAQLREIMQEKPYMRAQVAPKAELTVPENERMKEKALLRQAKQLFDLCARFLQMPPDIPLTVLSGRNAGRLANYIADTLPLPYEDKQLVLEENDPLERLQVLCVILARENQLQEVEANIHEQVRHQMDQSQRENFLREQRRAISAELGDGDSAQEDASDYRTQLVKLKLDTEIEEKLLKEIARLERMSAQSPESSMLSTYLETALALPWNKLSKDRLQLDTARKKLEKDHYGLREVKDRIVELLAVRKLTPGMAGQILCLVGPPGVGKTSVARSVADAMGRKFARISLGGIRDEAEIRGHRKTYVGAMPGRILNALSLAGSRNPVLLLDEIDKLCNDLRGDPSSALLEVMDGEQNATFRDHYLELPFDLSQVLFITTANDRYAIPAPLLDRMEVIELPSYTAEEKYHIAKMHLLPKQLKRHGLHKNQLRLQDTCLRLLIEGYTREAGVRRLEQRIAALCRKCALRVAEDPEYRRSLKAADLEEMLGARRYKDDHRNREPRAGVANGLAWTAVGGEIMPIEALVMPGTGQLKLTGCLGSVMKESAEAAVSYLRYHAKALEIMPEFHKENDIHIHVPEGAVPKDGPSAGVTIYTALLSALRGQKVNPDLAMTGEITLTGRVLPIGGLREKAMAAYRSGVRSVLIPEENLPDLEKVDEAVKSAVRFHGVTQLSELSNYALLPTQRAGTQV